VGPDLERDGGTDVAFDLAAPAVGCLGTSVALEAAAEMGLDSGGHVAVGTEIGREGAAQRRLDREAVAA
jgi:hypothetical protein